jgi:hypothetical protein
VNRKVAGRAVFLTSIVVALAVAGAVFAAVLERRSVALGIACGAGIAIVCGVSWILGALATFDGPMNRLLKATLGLGPVRFVLALGGVCAIGVWARDFVDMVALGSSFVVAHLLLQLMEADIFMRLADASSRYPRAKPIRFGGLRLW